MGTYQHDFIESVFARHPSFPRPRRAVETGTCLGFSTRLLSALYAHVDTIELSEALSERTEADLRACGLFNIAFHVGDSAEALPYVIATVHEPCLFYLDAHWSGDSSVDWTASSWGGYGVETAHLGLHGAPPGERPSSEEQVPLLDELRAIHGLFPYEAIVYVDDYAIFGPDGRGRRDVGFVGNDWSHLTVEMLKEACSKRLLDWIVSPDGSQLAIVLSQGWGK
jgi:hypothetical protein